jgi:hypothetical protein
MKWSRYVALAILLSGASCFGLSAPKTQEDKTAILNPPFSISVDFPNTPVRLRSPITVNITLTNVSNKEIWLQLWRDKNATYKAFSIMLMKDGREVETTFFHRKITGKQRPDDPPEVESGSLFPVVFPPGKMFVAAIDLKQLYEITEPGVYTLDVSRFDEQSKSTIRSKTVTFKLEPKLG